MPIWRSKAPSARAFSGPRGCTVASLAWGGRLPRPALGRGSQDLNHQPYSHHSIDGQNDQCLLCCLDPCPPTKLSSRLKAHTLQPSHRSLAGLQLPLPWDTSRRSQVRRKSSWLPPGAIWLHLSTSHSLPCPSFTGVSQLITGLGMR